MIFLEPIKESKEILSNIKSNWIKRYKYAKRLFLKDVSLFMVDTIKDDHPIIYINGKKWSYANDLKIGIIDSNDDIDTIIYIDGKKEKIDMANINNVVLYFVPNENSEAWVYVMEQYGPWPANLIPFSIKNSKKTKIISRVARNDEAKELGSRILRSKNDIESDLRESGINNCNVEYGTNGLGLIADIDIGYNILRGEFGFLDKRSKIVWRKSIEKTKEYANRNLYKIWEYILNGDKNIFNDDSLIGTITGDGYKSGLWFGRKLER